MKGFNSVSLSWVFTGYSRQYLFFFFFKLSLYWLCKNEGFQTCIQQTLGTVGSKISKARLKEQRTLFSNSHNLLFLRADDSDGPGRQLGDGYRAIRDLLCISSSINDLALQDCCRDWSRRLSDAGQIWALHHSLGILCVHRLENMSLTLLRHLAKTSQFFFLNVSEPLLCFYVDSPNSMCTNNLVHSPRKKLLLCWFVMLTVHY